MYIVEFEIGFTSSTRATIPKHMHRAPTHIHLQVRITIDQCYEENGIAGQKNIFQYFVNVQMRKAFNVCNTLKEKPASLTRCRHR